jgi:hypothetical protein
VIPERYFPFFSPEFTLTVGARPLAPGDHLIEIDPAEYAKEIHEKLACLAADPAYYCQALPGTEAAQREAVGLLKQDTAGRLTYPRIPETLDAFGRHVPEDLLLLDPQFRLAAGQLCFANAWCLEEKIGLGLNAVHAPVPHYATKLAQPVEKLLERLKPERPVWRVNWALRPTPRLDLTSRHRLWLETQKTGRHLEDCWLRVERQTLSRLPRTGYTLFTIHTYQQHFTALSPHQQSLTRAVLASTPPETLHYKGLAFLRTGTA